MATLAAAGAIGLWCWSGPCFAAGSRALGAMPYLTLASLTGVVTGMMLHRHLGKSFRDLFFLPVKVLVAGFFGVALYTVLLGYAVGIAREADIAQVFLINYLWPIWMIILGMIFTDDKAKPLMIFGAAALGFGGVLVIKGPEILTRTPASLLPHALSLGGAFLWAFYSVMLKRWRIPEEKCGATVQFIACAALSALVGIWKGQWKAMPPVTPSALFWVLFCGIGPVGLAYYWWEIGIKRGSVHFIALLSYFIPVVSAVLIGLLFREAMSPMLIPGALLIASGAWLGRHAVRNRAAAS